MKKYLFLFLLPSLSYGFQSELSGAYISSDFGNDSSVTSYTGMLKYYTKDLSNDSKPFKESAFLTSTSSFGVIFGKANYDLQFTDADGAVFGFNTVLYNQQLALDLTYLSTNISSDFVDVSGTSISIEPGIKTDESSLVFGIMRLESFEDEDTVTYGLGYKTFINNTNMVIETSQSFVDDLFTESEYNETAALAEYYISNSNYIGLQYAAVTGDDIIDETSFSLSLGGLIEKDINYQVEYTEITPDSGSVDTSLILAIGVYF